MLFMAKSTISMASFHAVPRGGHRGPWPPATVRFTSRLRWRVVERCGCAAPGRSEAPRYAKARTGFSWFRCGFILETYGKWWFNLWKTYGKPMETSGKWWFNMV